MIRIHRNTAVMHTATDITSCIRTCAHSRARAQNPQQAQLLLLGHLAGILLTTVLCAYTCTAGLALSLPPVNGDGMHVPSGTDLDIETASSCSPRPSNSNDIPVALENDRRSSRLAFGPHWLLNPTCNVLEATPACAINRYIVDTRHLLPSLAAAAGTEGLVYVTSLEEVKPLDWVEVYEALLKNLIASSQRANISSLLVFTSKRLSDKLLAEGILAVHQPSLRCMTKQFNIQNYLKWLYVLNVISTGYDVVYVDLDVAFARGRAPNFSRAHHFEFASSSPTGRSRRAGSGFFYAKSDPETARAIAELLAAFESDAEADETVLWRRSDEHYLNEILLSRVMPNRTLDIRLLPVDEVASGFHYWHMHKFRKEGNEVQPYAVHASWAAQRSKAHALREVGLWHLNATTRQRRLLSYIPPSNRSFETEMEALRSALGVAFATGRSLVLPSIPCILNPVHKEIQLGDSRGLCSPSAIFEIESLIENFEVREHNYLKEFPVPLEETARVTFRQHTTDSDLESIVGEGLDDHEKRLLILSGIEHGFSFSAPALSMGFGERLKRALKCRPEQWVYEACQEAGIAWPYTRTCERDARPLVAQGPRPREEPLKSIFAESETTPELDDSPDQFGSANTALGLPSICGDKHASFWHTKRTLQI